MNCKIRLMNAGEAVDVVRLFHECFENTYFPQCYDLENIVKQNAEGSLSSFIALTEEDEIIGHTALARTPVAPRMAEVVMSVVHPRYQHYGVYSQLLQHICADRKKLKKEGLNGMGIKSIVNHPYVQQTVCRAGFKDCGLFLGNFQIISFKGFASATPQRTTAMLSYLGIARADHLMIFPSERHQRMVDKLFRQIGRSADCLRPAAAQAELLEAAPAVIQTHMEENMGFADLGVLSYGHDVIPRVRARVNELCGQGIEAVFLYLDLSHPLTFYLTTEFEKMGFLFAGILPETAVGPALILQYLNHVKLVYDEMHVISETGRELLSYIRNAQQRQKPAFSYRGEQLCLSR